MEFRPCIDIHNGKVKQIVGASLSDHNDYAKENFVAEQDAAFYARFYQKDSIRGGHMILLNPQGSAYYDADKRQAFAALSAYPGGMQVGGGITPENAVEFLEAGASPQEARSILPNSLKTEIVVTMNLREWRHFFRLRTAPAAHPQMREAADMLLAAFQAELPVIFDDLSV